MCWSSHIYLTSINWLPTLYHWGYRQTPSFPPGTYLLMWNKSFRLLPHVVDFFLFFFFCFLGPHLRHMEVPRLEVESELQLPAYATAHGNAGSLTHWARPGIELTPSWILVGFEPWWELQYVVNLDLHSQIRGGKEFYINFFHIWMLFSLFYIEVHLM